MIIVDAHQDLAWNMLTFGRDYTLAAAETRDREQGSIAVRENGDTLLGWPDYQRGRVAIIFSTIYAAPPGHKKGEWDTQAYHEASEAEEIYQNQLDAYRRLVDEHPEKFRLLKTQSDLQAHLEAWRQETATPPVGLVVLMEGAEGVRSPAAVEEWWQRGVRIIGPAWAGTRFCGGTDEPGPLTSEGYELLEAMADIGLTLDISHMDEQAVLPALDMYPGAIIASHANAKALLKGTDSNRFLSDRVIEGLLERDGIIGIIPYNRFLLPGWRESDGRERVPLDYVAAQIDYICQIAGDADHVGIGSDFDGGFGLQKTPAGIDTVADLGKIAPLLAQKGYSQENIAAILGQNWIRFLENRLPKGSPL